MAVVAYSEPRFTRDMGILLSPERFAVSIFVRRLRESYYHVDEIAVNAALVGGFFNVIHLACLVFGAPVGSKTCRISMKQAAGAVSRPFKTAVFLLNVHSCTYQIRMYRMGSGKSDCF